MATKDGVLVCFHDDMVDHLLHAYGDVADYTWDELQELRFRNPGRFGKYCRIPTLREAFELHANTPDLTGWGQVLGEFFSGEVVVINHALSGRCQYRSDGIL